MGGWGGYEYEHYFEQLNWLSNNQKLFAVIAVKSVKTDIIHNYVPEEAIIHNYMPEEEVLGLINIQIKVKEKKFSLFGEKVFIMESLIWFWVLFHVFLAILIRFLYHLLSTYVLMKRQFSILILLGNFTTFDLKKRGTV